MTQRPTTRTLTYGTSASPMGGPTMGSRPETAAEQDQNARVARRAAEAMGLPVQACRIDYYGDRALVRIAGRSVWVSAE